MEGQACTATVGHELLFAALPRPAHDALAWTSPPSSLPTTRNGLHSPFPSSQAPDPLPNLPEPCRLHPPAIWHPLMGPHPHQSAAYHLLPKAPLHPRRTPPSPPHLMFSEALPKAGLAGRSPLATRSWSSSLRMLACSTTRRSR